MKRELLCALAVALTGCASAKPILRTVNDASQVLCMLHFAEKRGISAEDAMRIYCATSEQLQPWIEDALAAQRKTGLKLDHKIEPTASTVYLERTSDAGAD